MSISMRTYQQENGRPANTHAQPPPDPSLALPSNRCAASYEHLSFRHAVSEYENFVWCIAGCGYGQCHDGGNEQPIVTCRQCNQRSCFRHGVAWHETLSCDEYDGLQADPENFRSRLERDNEGFDAAQENIDRALAQSLLAQELEQLDEARRESTRLDAARKAAEESAERERVRQELDETRRRVVERGLEEELSQKIVASTSKPCPGCGWSIEKNEGW